MFYYSTKLLTETLCRLLQLKCNKINNNSSNNNSNSSGNNSLIWPSHRCASTEAGLYLTSIRWSVRFVSQATPLTFRYWPFQIHCKWWLLMALEVNRETPWAYLIKLGCDYCTTPSFPWAYLGGYPHSTPKWIRPCYISLKMHEIMKNTPKSKTFQIICMATKAISF